MTLSLLIVVAPSEFLTGYNFQNHSARLTTMVKDE